MEEIIGVVAPVPKDEWNNLSTYEQLNIVRCNTSLFMAKQSVPAGVEPGVTANWTDYWMLLISPLAATDVVEQIYPVGSIYVSADNASPAVKYGGTWEQITDRFLLAASDVDDAQPTYSGGETGGSKDATLVLHAHFNGNWATDISYTDTIDVPDGNKFRIDVPGLTNNTPRIGNLYYAASSPAAAWQNTANFISGNTTTAGENGNDKNMPPYLAVYIWKRIA